jgi:asparaginyl-tRNA synthetase
VSDDQVAIDRLPEHEGEEVRLRGWVRNVRSSGRILFVILRDGTGEVQVVVARDDVDDASWEAAEGLGYEASVRVRGAVKADERAPGGVEVSARGVEVVGPSADYPIQPKEHGVDFLLEHRHLWLRHPRQRAILRVRHEVVQAIRDFLYGRGFVLVDTPILTGSIGEEAGTLFETEYFEEGTAYLAQTGQLYLEAAAAAHGDVYCFGPTFRAEESKSPQHLTEFWMVEPEMAWTDSEESIQLQEAFVRSVVRRALERCGDELEALGRDVGRLEAAVEAPFERMTYSEAVEEVRGRGYDDIEWGDDLRGESEDVLMEGRERPLFVEDWPREAKAFYMKENPEDPRTVKCDDLLAPEGYGEIIGGSQREDDRAKLLERIREEGLPEDAYGWYLDLREYGTFPHSGFGLGVERTVAWITGVEHVRECIPFPRLVNRLEP